MKVVVLAFCTPSMTERFLKESRWDEYKDCFSWAFDSAGFMTSEYDHMKYPISIMFTMDDALYHKHKTFLGRLNHATDMAMSYIGWEKQLNDFLSNTNTDVGIIHISTPGEKLKKVYQAIEDFATNSNKRLVKHLPHGDDEMGLFWACATDNSTTDKHWDAICACHPGARLGMSEADYVDECLDSLDNALSSLVQSLTGNEPKSYISTDEEGNITYHFHDTEYNAQFKIGV